MEISVVIISHNEEKYIEECIKSILNQTQKPDEVILVVHNGTDKTLELAKKYPINVIRLEGEYGPIYARIDGIKNTSKNIILCIDGDAVAQKNWVEIMSKTLNKNNNILVGSYIKINGTIFDSISNIWNKYFCATRNKQATPWLWGASFGFWSRNKNLVLEIFDKKIKTRKELNLKQNREAEDYWLALYMSEKGNIEITNKTYVTAHAKEATILEAIKRNKLNHENGTIIKNFFKKEKINTPGK